MTDTEFRQILAALSLRQTGPHSPAALFQRGDRTVRRSASGEQPVDPAAQIALRLMERFGVTFEEAAKLVD